MFRTTFYLLTILVLFFKAPSVFALPPDACEISFTKLLEKRNAIPEGTQLIVAANRLPYSVSNNEGQWSATVSAGGLVSALKSTGKNFEWVGWAGKTFKKRDMKKVKATLDGADDKLSLTPIPISMKEKKDYYDEFSNRQLWPLFHDMTEKAAPEIVGWETYQQVNEKFAASLLTKVKDALAKSDGKEKPLVWVQDYQLMLVPLYLRRMLEKEGLNDKVRIGFFLHIPFPSVESLKTLPPDIRKELLSGLTASDEVAFHSKNYSKNFIDNVREETSALASGNTIRMRGRSIAVREHPIGINPETYRDALKGPKAQAIAKSLREKYKGYKVLLGVERLDPIKGIPEKLLAFERFLEQNPSQVGKSVLIQVAQPSRTDLPEYMKLKDDINAIAKRINERFSKKGKLAPVQLDQNGFGIDELVAHYSVADATMVTSLKDGMNLVAFEAVSVQKGSANPGTLILSQETGAAEWLNGALKIDPKNVDQVAASIKTALEMPIEERLVRAKTNLQHVDTNTSNDWVADSLESLNSGGLK